MSHSVISCCDALFSSAYMKTGSFATTCFIWQMSPSSPRGCQLSGGTAAASPYCCMQCQSCAGDELCSSHRPLTCRISRWPWQRQGCTCLLLWDFLFYCRVLQETSSKNINRILNYRGSNGAHANNKQNLVLLLLHQFYVVIDLLKLGVMLV